MPVDRNVLDIDDLDRPIYRTYDKERFLQLMTGGRDALVWPRKWEDPFENFFLRSTGITAENEPVSLEVLERQWYGQCWTYNEDSDALWRIYSPNKDGIKVRTTIRKLFDNLKKSPGPYNSLKFFIGKVVYMSSAEILHLVENTSFSDVAVGGQNQGFARLLCIKREAFAHENEVRLLFNNVAGHESNHVYSYPLNVNEIFEEIVIDPRLNDDEAALLQKEVTLSGATIPIRRSDLYRLPRLTVKV